MTKPPLLPSHPFAERHITRDDAFAYVEHQLNTSRRDGVHLACRTGVLAPHAARRLALFQEPGLVDDQHRKRVRSGRRRSTSTADIAAVLT